MPTTIDVSGSGARAYSGSATAAVFNAPSNDDIANATTVTYTSSDLTASPVTDAITTLAATQESGEDVLGGTPASGGQTQGTIWYRFVNSSVPAGNKISISSSDPFGFDLWAFPAGSPASSSDFGSLEPRGGSKDPGVVFTSGLASEPPTYGYAVTPVAGGPSMSWTVKAGEQYYVRIHALGYSEPLSGHVTYSVAPPEIDLTIQNPVLASVPGSLTLNIQGGTSNGNVTYKLDGVAISGVVSKLNFDGDIVSVVIQIPYIAPGAHMLLATDVFTGYTSGAQGSFTVGDQFAYSDDPTPGTFTLPATPTPGADGVLRFLLTDPTDNSTYSFPINPSSSSTSAGIRTLVPGSTTSPDGTPILWEGGSRGRVATLNGDLLTLEQRTDLAAWCAKPYRVFMSDDIGRQWVVMLRTLATQPVFPDVRNPEHCTYVLTLLFLGRVPDLDIPNPDYPEVNLYPSETLYPVDL